MNNSLEHLYKTTSNQTSPSTLDDFILNQAKQSCQPTITKVKPRKWLYPVATAAVFVMGFTVIFNLQDINQNMQTAPQTYNLDEATEIEFLPENTPLKPNITSSQSQPVKKKNAPLKPKLEKSKSISRSELKQDTSVNMSAPVAIIPSIKAKQSKIDADLGFATDDSSAELSTENSTKESVTEAQSPLADEINEQETDEQLDKVVVTGSRIRRTNLTSSNELLADIQKLHSLINNKDSTKAKELLAQLKIKYPEYDFATLEQKLLN
ncbi:MAG: hypothetical protein L3J53_00215 [Proteobacteria bacterium]|nr:hypothetical protein [Pseudomonadota bacterium]